MHKTLMQLLIVAGLLILVAGVPNVFGKKPPWSGGPENPGDYPPVSAPEPTTLSLLSVAVAGGAGYYLIRRKQKK